MKATNSCPIVKLEHLDIDFGTLLPFELGMAYTAGASRQAAQTEHQVVIKNLSLRTLCAIDKL
jgi:hypothetical protein